MRVLYSRFKEFSATSQMANDLLPLPSAAVTKWLCPPLGTIKINADASVKNGLGSIGVVARNHLGEVIKVHVYKERIELLEAAKAVAVLEAISLATATGFRYLCVESDAKNIIRSLNDQDICLSHWTIDGFIRKIKDQRYLFDSITFTWVPRHINRLAHAASCWGLVNAFNGPISPFFWSKTFTNIMN